MFNADEQAEKSLIKKNPLELLAWLTALLWLALFSRAEHHFTLCPFANIGIEWCPGCGFGRSLRHLLHGDLAASIQSHWFGVPGFLILLYRIYTLCCQFLLSLKDQAIITNGPKHFFSNPRDQS